MKTTIHPEYMAATVSCACGNTWQTMATRPALRVESCNFCNPLFLGEERIVRATGSRVERFRRRYAARSAVQYVVTDEQRQPRYETRAAAPEGRTK